MKRMDLPLEKRMDQALMTLALAFQQSGKNKKPVLLHSIRVGMLLFEHDCDEPTILAGILHDILEDTTYDPTLLQAEYGQEILQTVQALTLNRNFTDKLDQNLDSFRRCQAMGPRALLIRCADMISNIPFYPLARPEIQAYLLSKYERFSEYSKSIQTTALWAKFYVTLERYVYNTPNKPHPPFRRP